MMLCIQMHVSWLCVAEQAKCLVGYLSLLAGL